jgi:hypothetical protein
MRLLLVFFECSVAKVLWGFMSEMFNVNIGHDFESVARWWVSDPKEE